jgi:MscS family membrane protein
VRRVLSRSIFVVLLCVLASLLSPTNALAQVKPTTPPPASADKPDEEAADSPRASMRAFFELADRGRYQDAARYLDLPKGSEKRAAELAHKLHVIVSQRLVVNPDQLSPLSQGRMTDALPPGTEELGKIVDAKGHPIAIRLVRHESKSPEDEARWVFSQSTVQHVDSLYEALSDRWVRDHLPSPLLLEGPKALYYWQWISLPVLAFVCWLVGRFLTFISGILASRLLARHSWSGRFLQQIKRPVTFAWGIGAFAVLLPYLALTLRAEELLERLLKSLGWLAFFWVLLRTVTIVGEEIAQAPFAVAKPSVRSLTAVGTRLGKVVVAAAALMVALNELGYPATSVVAGLGIGGVALALAAQKTVEHLFGSISILADKPFQVGDTIRVDGIEATVESIGLRSTRLRTVERTLVIIPNGKLADMRVESLGPRDRIRFSTKLMLARTTTLEQVKKIVETIRERLLAHERVRKEDVFVRLSAIGEASYDVDVAAPIETLDANEFARVKEQLLLTCCDVVEKAGARLAVPTRQVLDTRGSHA